MATMHVVKMCLVAMLASLLCGTLLAIHIEIKPEVFDKINNNNVQISCLQDNQVLADKNILFLEIKKGGKPLVVIRQNSQVSFTDGNVQRLTAVGHVDKDVRQSYLNLTMMTPKSGDAGRYTCVMGYLDEINILKVEKDSKNLTERKFNINAVEDQLAYLKQRIESNEMGLRYQNSDLHKSQLDIKAVQDSLAAHRQKLELNQKKIESLTNSISYRSAFFATSLVDINPTTGQVLKFSHIVSMEGIGYDSNTGVFTSPRTGLYIFTLTVRLFYTGQWIEVDLKVKSQTLSRLFAADGNYDDQTSISIVTRLEKGEMVKPEVRAKHSNGKLYGNPYSFFSGYLLQPM